MAKIEIDDQVLKSIVKDAIKEIFVPNNDAVKWDSIKWEEGNPGVYPVHNGPFSDVELKDIEISTLRKRVANYKTQAETYKSKVDDAERRYNLLLHRNFEVRKFNAVLKTENYKLAKELDEARKDAEMANQMVGDIGRAGSKMIDEEVKKAVSIEEEFEETVRGDLMNLKLIKKHLDEIRPTAKTKDEYLRVMKFINMEISNLDKFVEERWGHGEED